MFNETVAIDLFESTYKTQKEIGELAGVSGPYISVWSIARYDKEFLRTRKSECYRQSKLGAKNPMTGKHKEKHPTYKGIIDDGKGYKLILKPDWFTSRKGSKHVYYHQVVYCLDRGLTGIPDGMCIHHIDEDKLNNAKSNLIMLTKKDHSRLHQQLKRIKNISSYEEE